MADVIVFQIGSQRCLMPMARVVELAPMVRVINLASVELPVRGYVQFRGAPIAVVDVAACFGQPVPPVSLDHHLIIVDLGGRLVALRVDRVLNLDKYTGPPEPVERSASPLAGVVTCEDGGLFVMDLELLLSLEQRHSVAEALAALHSDGQSP